MLAPNWTLGRLFFGKRGLLPEKENELVGIAVYFYHFLNQETWCDEDNLQYISKCSVVKPGKKGRGMEIKKYCVSGWRPRFFQYRTVLAEGTLGVIGCHRSAVNLAVRVRSLFR